MPHYNDINYKGQHSNKLIYICALGGIQTRDPSDWFHRIQRKGRWFRTQVPGECVAQGNSSRGLSSYLLTWL